MTSVPSALTLSSPSYTVSFAETTANSGVTCPPIQFGTGGYGPGSSGSFYYGTYPLSVASPCSDGEVFLTWASGGSVSISGTSTNPTTATVTGNGSIAANFGWYYLTIAISVPGTCPSPGPPVNINGVVYPAGTYTTGALSGAGLSELPTCSLIDPFSNWVVSGGVTVGSSTSYATTISVTGSGTLTAVYS